MKPMKYRLVIFDFDGTLADSFPFFLRTVNALAEQHHFRQVDAERVDMLRQYDAKRILKELHVPIWKVPMVAASFRKSMAKHLDEIPMFAGVTEMLHALSQKGIILSLVTSNSYENVVKILGKENMSLMFHPQCGTALFGKSSKLKNILRKTGINPENAMYIGDELRDQNAAQADNIDFGAVAWGYTKADALMEHSPTVMFYRVEEIAQKLV